MYSILVSVQALCGPGRTSRSEHVTRNHLLQQTEPMCSVLAAIIYTSATLHAMEVPTPQIGAILATITIVNWTVFDRTPQGVLLAVLCGVGAPLSEVVLNAVFGLWHYPREDLPGMVSWYSLVSLLNRLGPLAWAESMMFSRQYSVTKHTSAAGKAHN